MAKRQRNLKAYAAVKDRSEGICERCKSRRAAHAHHRKLRSQGGEDTPENLRHLCTDCHNHVHAHPAESYLAGWLIRSWDEPRAEG